MTTTEYTDLSALEDHTDPNATRQQKLAEAKAAIAGTTPLIPEAPDCIVHLPRGLNQGGVMKTEAEVRELNGSDEESLSRAKESIDFFDLVLAHGVIRVDDVQLSSLSLAERQGLLRSLLVGERSQLLLAILVATYGDEKTLEVTCTHCDAEQEVVLHVKEDFVPKVVDDVETTIFHFTTAKGDHIEYRLVTGHDQLEALKRKGSTTAEQNTLILSRCIVRVNGEILPDPIGFARNMGIRDRTSLLEELVNRQPDVDLEVKMTCLGCGGDIRFALGWADLFRA